jgi:ComF family protein
MNFAKLLFYAGDYFFPRGCALCGASLLDPDEAWYGLCKDCLARLERESGRLLGEKRCGLCGRPLISEREICMPCRVQEPKPAYDRVVVLYPYRGIFRKVLRAYKFGKNHGLGHYFAEKISQALSLLDLSPGAALVPVPPRPGKLRRTGWDQIEFLAKILEKGRAGEPREGTSGKPPAGPGLNRCLKRLPSRSQKELDRAGRRQNLKGRIAGVKKAPLQAVIFDDVITTGSTLNVCAEVLKAGGAEKVYGVCLFYD